VPKNDIAECRDLTQRHVAAFVIQTVFLSRQAVGSETHERSCSVFLRCGTAVAASTAFRLSLFTAERRTATYRCSFMQSQRLRSVSAHDKQTVEYRWWWRVEHTWERAWSAFKFFFAAIQTVVQTVMELDMSHVWALCVSYLPHVLRFGRVLSLDA